MYALAAMFNHVQSTSEYQPRFNAASLNILKGKPMQAKSPTIAEMILTSRAYWRARRHLLATLRPVFPQSQTSATVKG